jgi:translation initiation factor RLI1
MVKKQGTFTLTVEAGSFTSSQITILLGENGTGKTTFIKMLAGKDTDKIAGVFNFFQLLGSRIKRQLQTLNNCTKISRFR